MHVRRTRTLRSTRHEEMRLMWSNWSEWTARVDQTLAMGKDDLARAADAQSQIRICFLVVLLISIVDWKKLHTIEAAQTATEMSDQLVARLKTQLSEFEKSHNNAMVELMAEHTNKEKARLREAKASQEELKATLVGEKIRN